MNIIKEFTSYNNFFKSSTTHRQIVFFAEHEGYYSYFEGLIKELTDIHGLTVSYLTADANDPVLKTNNPRIKTFYINILLPMLMQFMSPKVFIMTMPDLNQYHIKKSSNPVHYIYIFHSLVSTTMMYQKGAFDHYDAIFCCGPHHIQEIRKTEEFYSLPPKQLIKTGYYRLERIYNAAKHIKPEPKTILIAPSWGENNILESLGVRLTGILLEAGYKVIVRPHPETIRRSPKTIEIINVKYRSNKNFILENSISTDDSLLKSRLLICDCSGVALEYAFGTGRPVLFIDVPHKIKNPDYKITGMEPIELSLRTNIGVITNPDNINSIVNDIQGVLEKENDYKNRINELKNNFVYNFGSSSAAEAEYIINLLKTGL